MSSNRRLAAVLMTTTSLIFACGGEAPLDAPEVTVSFPYPNKVVVTDSLDLDVVTAGCAYGPAWLQLLQNETEVARYEEPADLAQTRFAVPVDRLSLRGAEYPVTVTLSARFSCLGSAAVESEPASLELIPAQRRLGQPETRWPGYQLWVDRDRTLLFCDRTQIRRLDESGQELARSDVQLSCSSSTQLFIDGDRVLVLDGSSAIALDASLKRVWTATGQSVAFSGGRLLVVKQADTDSDPQAPIQLSALGLADGAVRWTSTLQVPSGKQALVAPAVAGSDGMVHVLTVNTIQAPLQSTLFAWTVNPAQPQSPSLTVLSDLAPFPVDGQGEAVGTPTGLLLASGAAAVIGELGAKNGVIGYARLRALELSSGEVLWEQSLDQQTPTFLPRAEGALVLLDQELLELGADGRVSHRFQAPAGSRLRQIQASAPGGAVLASLELGEEAGLGMALLDESLAPVFSVPFGTGFGAAVNPDGSLLFVSDALLQLLSPEGYRGLLAE